MLGISSYSRVIGDFSDLPIFCASVFTDIPRIDDLSKVWSGSSIHKKQRMEPRLPNCSVAQKKKKTWRFENIVLTLLVPNFSHSAVEILFIKNKVFSEKAPPIYPQVPGVLRCSSSYQEGGFNLFQVPG